MERYFKSENGSTVKVSGKHMGVYDIDFDWFEEDACCDAHPHFNGDMDEPEITAHCECCESMVIKLKEVTKEEFDN